MDILAYASRDLVEGGADCTEHIDIDSIRDERPGGECCVWLQACVSFHAASLKLDLRSIRLLLVKVQ